jgi:Methane oxygenase PmoA
MYRQVRLPVLVLGATVLASCSTPPPAGNANCEFKQAADGTVVCVPLMAAAPSPSTSGTAGGSPAVPDLGGAPAVPDLGGAPAVPDLTPTSMGTSADPAPTVTGPAPTVAGPAPTITGPAPTVTGPAPEPTGPSPEPTAPTPTATETVPDMTGPVPTETGPLPTVDPPAASLGSIQVSAGTLARDHSIVTFPFAEGQGKNLVLTDAQGTQIPLQVAPDGNAAFILPSLAAGATADFTIEELPAPMAAGITAAVESDHLFVKAGETQVFRWTLVEDNFRNRASRDVRAGYIYPLYTPGGLNVADDYAEDHPHMHGVWSAWTSTTFRGHAVDFWNGYNNQGRVDLESMDGAWSGAVHAGLIANLIHSDITTNPAVVVLNEKWTVTVYKTHEAPAPYYVFDIASTQSTATSDPLVLEQYSYGGFGFRGAQEWAVASNVSFLTSEGADRLGGDGQNARWVAQYGNINGQIGGYAGLDHPTNFRHPQGLRIHPSNPYWAFVPVTPLKGGRFTIEVGVPYSSRYRVVSFDGNADAALLNRLWDDYATPPTVVVTP